MTVDDLVDDALTEKEKKELDELELKDESSTELTFEEEKRRRELEQHGWDRDSQSSYMVEALTSEPVVTFRTELTGIEGCSIEDSLMLSEILHWAEGSYNNGMRPGLGVRAFMLYRRKTPEEVELRTGLTHDQQTRALEFWEHKGVIELKEDRELYPNVYISWSTLYDLLRSGKRKRDKVVESAADARGELEGKRAPGKLVHLMWLIRTGFYGAGPVLDKRVVGYMVESAQKMIRWASSLVDGANSEERKEIQSGIKIDPTKREKKRAKTIAGPEADKGRCLEYDRLLDPAVSWDQDKNWGKRWEMVKSASDFPEEDQERIASTLKRLEYKEFLKTPYWKSVAQHVRWKAGFKCEECGGKGELNVHHVTYDHHGLEHLHIEDLICLCKDCHTKHHDKDAK